MNIKNKTIIIILTLLITPFIISISFYYLYNFENISYTRKTKKILAKLEKENEIFSRELSNLTNVPIEDSTYILNLTNAIKKSEANIDTLINQLYSITVPEKYSKEHNKLIEAINMNKRIYTQSRLILNNLKSDKISKAAEDFDKYITNTQKLYNNLKIPYKIKLPTKFKDISNEMQLFAYKCYSNFEEKNRLYEQYQNYFSEIDKLINDFANIKINLSSYLDNIKKNPSYIKQIKTEIEKKLLKLELIHMAFLNISVPENLVEIHKNIDSIIIDFTNYCREFKECLDLLNISNKNEFINEKFEELNEKYNLINESWIKLLELYNQQKQSLNEVNNT